MYFKQQQKAIKFMLDITVGETYLFYYNPLLEPGHPHFTTSHKDVLVSGQNMRLKKWLEELCVVFNLGGVPTYWNIEILFK